MFQYQSSLRSRTIEEAFERARGLMSSLGISRVTEITRLDRVGLPVFVAIRPDAQPGSLCVSAGKGLTAGEARVGAVMESIELAWAEYTRNPIAVHYERADSISAEGARGILELCPRWGQTLDPAAKLACIAVDKLDSDTQRLVPAELLFHPLPAAIAGARYFGSSSNGLASGGTLEEATTHALAELIERDTTSFHNVRDRGRLVSPSTLPPTIAELHDRLASLGFALVIRHLPNEFGIPCFTAVLVDRSQPDITLRGDGCHPWKEIALTRAVTETAQCRLTLIHGGRDDLTNVQRAVSQLSDEERVQIYERAIARLSEGDDPIDYAQIADESAASPNLARAQSLLVERLRGGGFTDVLRRVYTPADYPVVVVRVIVPGLEHYASEAPRVGLRLRRYREATV